MCSLSEVQAIVAGRGQMTLIEEAMEVYQIGQFLDFPVLFQGLKSVLVVVLLLNSVLSHLSIHPNLVHRNRRHPNAWAELYGSI